MIMFILCIITTRQKIKKMRSKHRRNSSSATGTNAGSLINISAGIHYNEPCAYDNRDWDYYEDEYEVRFQVGSRARSRRCHPVLWYCVNAGIKHIIGEVKHNMHRRLHMLNLSPVEMSIIGTWGVQNVKGTVEITYFVHRSNDQHWQRRIGLLTIHRFNSVPIDAHQIWFVMAGQCADELFIRRDGSYWLDTERVFVGIAVPTSDRSCLLYLASARSECSILNFAPCTGWTLFNVELGCTISDMEGHKYATKTVRFIQVFEDQLRY